MQRALSETLVQKNKELLRDNIVKVIALFLAGWKRSWPIYAKLKGDFKSSATLKMDFNVIFSTLFQNTRFTKEVRLFSTNNRDSPKQHVLKCIPQVLKQTQDLHVLSGAL